MSGISLAERDTSAVMLLESEVVDMKKTESVIHNKDEVEDEELMRLKCEEVDEELMRLKCDDVVDDVDRGGRGDTVCSKLPTVKIEDFSSSGEYFESCAVTPGHRADDVCLEESSLLSHEQQRNLCDLTYGHSPDHSLTGSHEYLADVDSADQSPAEMFSGQDERSTRSEWVKPDPELISKLIKQVEFYFSDANITKDAFLLKHVKRNKQGYVNIKLISSFKKVKKLSRDWRSVAFALRQSDQLGVNEEGTKVQRLSPLPEYDETTPSRTVVAMNLPMSTPTVSLVADLFKDCGDIVLVRILHPRSSIPPDVKKHIMKHPELGLATCAVVEFTESSAARFACTMSDKQDWRVSLHISILAPTKKSQKNEDKTRPRPQSKQNKQKKGDNELTEPSSGVSPTISPSFNRKNDSMKPAGGEGRHYHTFQKDYRLTPRPCSHRGDKGGKARPSSPVSSPDMNRRKNTHQKEDRGHISSPDVRRKQQWRDGVGSSGHRGGDRMTTSRSENGRWDQHDGGGDREVGSATSPWVQRRRLAAQQGGVSIVVSPVEGGGDYILGLPSVKVIRQPRGPDGTKGFVSKQKVSVE